MGNVPQQFEAKSPATILPPAASMPSSNQTPLPPKKESHIVAIIILTTGSIFVVGAIIWLASDYITPGAKTQKNLTTTVTSASPTIEVSGSPTAPSIPPSTPLPSQSSPVYPVNAPPPPTPAEFTTISEGLRSGNSFKFAGVSGMDPRTIPESTLEKYAKMQAMVFDEKSFKVTPDGKKATVQVTITLGSGEKTHETFSFVVTYGRWVIVIDTGN